MSVEAFVFDVVKGFRNERVRSVRSSRPAFSLSRTEVVKIKTRRGGTKGGLIRFPGAIHSHIQLQYYRLPTLKKARKSS